MQVIPRRAILAAATALPAAAARRFDWPAGLEIYSFRREMAKDIPGTLALIRRIGFREVEVPGFYNLPAAGFRRALDTAGLKATAMVATYERLTSEHAAVESDLRTLGCTDAICPWIPHKSALTVPVMRRVAADLNTWGRALRAGGYRLHYHIHGYEFQPSPRGTLFDLLAKETDPAAVYFQLDVFWVLRAGYDPVKLLERYPRRFPLIHLKDMRKGTPVGDLTGKAPDEASVALGEGEVDWPRFFRAARRAGAERCYIEDESPDALRQVPASLAYLAKLAY